MKERFQVMSGLWHKLLHKNGHAFKSNEASLWVGNVESLASFYFSNVSILFGLKISRNNPTLDIMLNKCDTIFTILIIITL
jgi:hypothetical protein